MNKSVHKKINFTADIIRERSNTEFVEPLGKAENEMEFIRDENSDYGSIIWSIDYHDDQESDEVVMGVWFDGNLVTDYDGVFDLPVQAKELLASLGYDLSYIS